MSKTHIPRALRQRVITAASGRCAYCHTFVEITGARFVIDHIIPEIAGGETIYENLCLACHSCIDHWRDHFRWSRDGSHLIGLTATGRATIEALKMNHPEIVRARRRWASVGWHPPQEDLT